MKWIRKSADQGNADAQCNLGFAYSVGRGVEKNQKEATKWFLKAADQGNADAQCNLGAAYFHGIGIIKDVQAAYGWFLLATAGGNKEASLMVAFIAKNASPSERKAAQDWCKHWTPTKAP